MRGRGKGDIVLYPYYQDLLMHFCIFPFRFLSLILPIPKTSYIPSMQKLLSGHNISWTCSESLTSFLKGKFIVEAVPRNERPAGGGGPALPGADKESQARGTLDQYYDDFKKWK